MAEEKLGALPVDVSKTSGYGVAPESLQALRDALAKNVEALEQRYAQPNWFNVAAGFLKPQLGGFAASLGSAAGAMGENVERARATQLPIAQMRAQLAQADILMSKNQKVADMERERMAKNKPVTPDYVREVTAIAPGSDVAQALQSQLATQIKQQEITGMTQKNALEALTFARDKGLEPPPELYTAAGLTPPGVPPTGTVTGGAPAMIPPVSVPGTPVKPGETAPPVRVKEGEEKPERQYLRSDIPAFSPLNTQADTAKLLTESDKTVNDIANNRFKALEGVGNPENYAESQRALTSMIQTLTSNPKLAYKVTNPLGQQGGVLGGLMNVLENGVGFNVSGVAGNLNVPVSAAIIGSFDPKTERPFFDQLMQQAARVGQIQQKIANVNPGTIRNGEIEIYKNVSANPKSQGPNVMLYNLQYTKLNNEMLHEMYKAASDIYNNKHPEYAVHPNSRRPMADIMSSPVMADIAKKYEPRFQKLNDQFLSTLK